MGLQLSDVEKDPLVQKTLAVFTEAIKASYGEDFASKLTPELDLPPLKVLADMDALDSVSATVLSVGHLSSYVSLSDIAQDLDKDVAAAMLLMEQEMSTGPEELLASGNPVVLKLMIAAFSGAANSDLLKEMQQELPPSEFRNSFGELGDLVAEIADHLTQQKAWKDVPPKLLDAFVETVDRLAVIAPGRLQKRVLTEIAQELKIEIAKGASDDITLASAPPQIDPASPFAQLKANARKFKPGLS